MQHVALVPPPFSADGKVGIFESNSIMRAGAGFLDGMLQVIPGARVGHIGLYRDPKTLVAIEYYFKMPADMTERDAIVLDPPTFSQSTGHGAFRAEKNYGKLAAAALPLLKAGGILFASTNAADWPPENFLMQIKKAVFAARRKILQRHYVPQPPDFPISRAEPAHLKTVWLRIV